jgi:MscS family membrane protein
MMIGSMGGSFPAWAKTVTDFPLQPPDTSSPRATLDSFLSNMQETHRLYTKAMKRYKEEPGWYFSEAVRGELERALLLLTRASRCLDLSEVPPPLVERVGFESTLLLKTIFDRISIPPLEEIPKADEMHEKELSRWRLPNTEITIAKVLKGPREGEFLFTPSTVDRLHGDYELIKHLPHKPGGWEGVYRLYTEVSGTIIPDKLIFLIPSWAKIRLLNQPLWKWGLTTLLLIAIFLILTRSLRFSRGRPEDSPLHRVLRRIVFPISLMFFFYLLEYLQKEIGFVGDVSEGMTKIFLGLTFLGAGWTIILIGNIIAEGVITYPSVTVKGLDADMIRVVARIFSFAIAAWVIVIGAQIIGIPLAPVLAGLGIGGLALALSAQTTVENFIGGMTLFADRPVRLGELVKFGDKFGEVEEIGMRSTRIRTLARTLVTIPNAEFSKLHLENFTKRDKMKFHPRIRLSLDTTPDQFRYILIEIRKMLYAHPKVLQDPVRVRFVEFGTYSLDIEVFIYIDATDPNEYLGIAEDLYLRILEVLAQAGSGLAVPAHREYSGEIERIDEKRVREVEAEVEAWRKTNSVYLPSFPKEKISDLEGTIEYPSPGFPKKGFEKDSETK